MNKLVNGRDAFFDFDPYTKIKKLFLRKQSYLVVSNFLNSDDKVTIHKYWTI